MSSPNKTVKSVQGAFFGASKKVIMDLTPTVDDRHLFVGIEEEAKVSPKKNRARSVATKSVQKVSKGSEKAESLSEFEDVFDSTTQPYAKDSQKS